MTSTVAAPARDSRWRLVQFGLGLILLESIALALHDRWDADYAFVAAALLGGGVYLLAVRAIVRSGQRAGMFAIVVGFAVIFRLLLLGGPTIHSSDAYRYVWDGRVQSAGINPYRHKPIDQAVAHLRDEAVYPHINRADYAVTIYPPVAQMAFRLFHFLGDSLLGLKLGFLALEGLAMWVLVRLLVILGRPPEQLLLYAWHPLPIWEIAGDGHVDAGMMILLVVALWASTSGRRLLTGALLAGSVLFKPATIAALPAFWRPWDWRAPLAFSLAAVAAYVPYLDVGAGVIGFLIPYTGEEGLGDGRGFFLLALLARLLGSLPAHAYQAYLVAAGLILGGLALAAVRDPRRDLAPITRQAQWLLFAFLLLLSPNYPWYFLVLVPFVCLAPWPPAIALTLTAVVLYTAPPIDGEPEAFFAQAALHAVVTVVFAIELYRRWKRTDNTPESVHRNRPHERR